MKESGYHASMIIIIIIIIIIILLISCRFGNFFYIFGNWLFASFLHQITEILNLLLCLKEKYQRQPMRLILCKRTSWLLSYSFSLS